MENNMGTLYLVGTPIGNLEDITYRAVRILGEVDLIAAEDTRHSIKLLNHFDIHTKMVAYHQHNEMEGSEKLRDRLRQGMSIALISDAGMPIISDPGYQLVKDCVAEGIPVTVVPGPNAGLCGVVLSGMDCRHFTFMGFMGRQNKDVREGLEALRTSACPVVLYEAPHHLLKFLKAMAEALPQRQLAISREITKQYEETKRGTAPELLTWFTDHPPKGEFVIVVEGHGGSLVEDEILTLMEGSLKDHLTYYLNQSMAEKEAMKKVAADRGISKRDVYQSLKVKA